MSVDYSVDVMYGIELDITSQEYFENIDPDWDCSKHKVEISQFGDSMGGGPNKYIAFYQPSFKSFDKWNSSIGCWSMDDLITIDEQLAWADIMQAVDGLKTVGKPQWYFAHSVS